MRKEVHKMATSNEIESTNSEVFLHFIIDGITDSLNVGIIEPKRLQPSVNEVSIPGIYKDYVVTHTHRRINSLL